MAVNRAATMWFPVITRRMIAALALSLLAHVLLAEFWVGASGVSPGAAHMPPQVWLNTGAVSGQLRPAFSSLSSGMDEGQQGQILPPSPSFPRGVATPRISVAASHPAAGRKAVPAEPAAESATDHRFYLARELDHFPAPLSPLILDSAAAGSVRLWVSIDRTGKVLDAVVVAAPAHDAHDAFAQIVRERVLAAPFRPARKDAHAVSSRVLLVFGESK